MIRTEIFESINKERDRQDRLHGKKNELIPALSEKRLIILGEEFGECCMALDSIGDVTDDEELEFMLKHYMSELIQVAACCVQNVERISAEYNISLSE